MLTIGMYITPLEFQLKALLHGHSYSAHAMGCAAAVKSIKWFKDYKTNMNLIPESRLLHEVKWQLLSIMFGLCIIVCFRAYGCLSAGDILFSIYHLF